MKTAPVKLYSLDEMKDEFIGERGSLSRDRYEYALRMEVLGRMIRTVRRQHQLTQAELGDLVGVQKAQISKWEHGVNSATVATIIKIFSAMNAEIHFSVRSVAKRKAAKRT